MAALTPGRLATLMEGKGDCNHATHQEYVSASIPFTVEDVAAIQDTYFDGQGGLTVRLSDLPGKICWESLGAMENRKMVNRLAANCEKVLEGAGAAEKCEAISDVIHQMPIADPEFLSAEGAKKWGVSALAATGGFASLYFLFAGPAHDTWAKIKEKWHNRKGPPDGPSAGAGGGHAAAPLSSDAAPIAPPVAEARVVSRAYRDYWRHRDSGVIEDDPIGNALIALPLGLVNIARSGVVLTAEAVHAPFQSVMETMVQGAMKLAF